MNKTSIGGVRYQVHKKMMYFKPVADKHLQDFQNLLSCEDNFELSVDLQSSSQSLKESMSSSSSNSVEAELCFPEVFYDVYMRSLVDNLRTILLSNPKVGPKLKKRLTARKIQIAPAPATESSSAVSSADMRRSHRTRITMEGVLVLEYMWSTSCLSNTHLIGRDLDQCVVAS